MALEEQVIGFAFGAGVLTFFSPCSIAMLPAYVSHYVGRGEGSELVANRRDATCLALAVASALLGGALVVGSWLHNELRIFGSNFGAFGLFDRLILLTGIALLAIAGYVLVTVWQALGSAALRTLGRAALRGVGFGLATSAGFLTIFGGIGLLLLAIQRGPLASGVRSALPFVSLVTVLILFALGMLLFLNRDVSWIPRTVAPRARNALSFYVFGLGYALVATGCLLPVFLLVVNAALLVPATTGALALVAYALGSGILMTFLSVYVATASATPIRVLRRFRRYVKRVSGFVVMEMAAYLLWFDYVGVLRPLEGVTVLGDDPLWLLAIPPGIALLYVVARRRQTGEKAPA